VIACFNASVSKVILMAAGACLELLFVVLPLAHLSRWAAPPPTVLVYSVALLPIMVVLVALLRPEPRLTVGLVPLSHLPLLMIEPRLTSSLVYAGASGIGTWALTVGAAVAWTVCALRYHRGPPTNGRFKGAPIDLVPMVWAPVGTALIIWVVFLVPLVVSPRHGEPTGAVTAALIGLVVSLWVGFRWFGRDLAELAMSPRARSRLRTQVLLRRRFSPQIFWSSVAVSLALGIVTSVVYGAV
jgi:hypothetical protein